MSERPRGRPRLANPRRRRVWVRCTDAEADAIQRAADAAGMEVADFLRDRATGGDQPRAIRAPRVDRWKLAQVLVELHQVGPWLNDLAHAVNAGEGSPTRADLVELTRRTQAMRDLLREALDGQEGA